MTYKIVDIADEIYRELGEPSDLSLSSIAFWLRTNIGDLNILINKKFYIIDSTLEIGIEEDSGDEFKDIEKSILKMIYSMHYYERLFRNALGAASTDSVIEISQNGFSAKKVNKNELAKTYSQLRKQIADELQVLTKNYNLNEARPLQVAGDDTIGGVDGPFKYGSSSSYIRNIDNL
jgi:beta-mannanase